MGTMALDGSCKTEFTFSYSLDSRFCSNIHLPVEVLEVLSPEESHPTEL